MSVTRAGLEPNLPKVDGRRQRSERTRQLIIEAFLQIVPLVVV